ncbi:MAG: hypothetical protein ACI3ZK_04645 [Candidatus Cryptobacteroides sp.]
MEKASVQEHMCYELPPVEIVGGRVKKSKIAQYDIISVQLTDKEDYQVYDNQVFGCRGHGNPPVVETVLH